MTHTLTSQPLTHPKAPGRSLGSTGHWRSRLVFAAGTTLCISISAAAWSETENFGLANFDGISAAQGIHMHVTTGEDFAVAAESDDARQLEFLKLGVRRGILRAQMDEKLFSTGEVIVAKVTIHVTMPDLTQAEALTGAEIVTDAMSGPDLEMTASSGSSLWIEVVDGGTMSVNVSSGASIEIAGGTCQSLSADVSGGSSLEMEKVACLDAEIEASSGSDVSVHADNLITADASSGARIRVHGAHAGTIFGN